MIPTSAADRFVHTLIRHTHARAHAHTHTHPALCCCAEQDVSHTVLTDTPLLHSCYLIVMTRGMTDLDMPACNICRAHQLLITNCRQTCCVCHIIVARFRHTVSAPHCCIVNCAVHRLVPQPFNTLYTPTSPHQGEACTGT